jgi:hypothetical protein
MTVAFDHRSGAVRPFVNRSDSRLRRRNERSTNDETV